MYRSGGFFKYEPNPFFSIISDLQRTQNKAKDIQHKMNQHKNDLLYLDYSIKDLQYAINDNFKNLKNDLIVKGENIKDITKQKFNKQKVVNTYLWKEVNEVNHSFKLLKDEIDSLKKRIDKFKKKI